MPSPAFAYIEIERADGSVLLIDEKFVLVLLVAFVVIAVFASILSLSGAPTTYTTVTLPPEISTPEPVQYYEEHAARARALKNKLDTELAESYINAMRTKGELDELGEILGHDKIMRLTTRGDRT
jgi:hypothetical protein